MATQCNGCGDCCSVLFLPRKLEAGEHEPKNRKWFVSGALVPISQAEAIERKPVLGGLHPHEWDTGPEGDPAARIPYKCLNFNEQTRGCRLHGTPDKPECCTGFPWYGKEPDADRLRSMPVCSFWADIQPQWLLGLS